MKNLLGILTLAAGMASLALTARAQSDINLTNYNLTFDDEFNTLSLTTASPKGSANWYGLPPNGAAGYFSAGSWNASAFSVSGGILTDQAYYSGGWQSGFMASVDTTVAGFTQTYGYFEIRCQMPNAGEGAWPAFWLDTTAGITGGQGNEEVDIFEWYGICDTPGSYQDVVQQTSHNWNTDGSQNTTTAPYLASTPAPMPGGQYPWQGYHIYGCQIDPAHMTWYIDGVQTNQCATPTAYLGTPFYVMVNYALGGGWSLTGIPFSTDGSSSFLVDWVRVYSLPTVPPPAPAGLTATAGNASVNLTWSSSQNAATYNVYRGTSPGGENTTPIATGITSTTYIDSSSTNGTTYYYEVAAVNSYGTSSYSNEVVATPLVTLGSIGVQFQGSGTALPSTALAGLPTVEQANWNVLTGASFTNQAMTDNNKSNTTAIFNGSANGGYFGGSITASPAGNADLTSGELVNTWPGGPTLTFSNIPYTQYDVYVYADIDAAGRNETISLTPSNGSAQYYSFTTESGGSVWTQGTNTWNGSGTAPALPSANYVHFTGLTAGSFTLNWGAPGNGGLNAIQIVGTSGTGGGSAPVITSVSTGSGTVGSAFSYQIIATNSPTSYNATGLPSGLSVNTSSGAITGTPTASGVSTVTLSAINASGTGTGTLTLTVNAAVPVITSAGTASGTVNSAFNYQITASNSPTSYNATGLPSGLSVNTSTGAITGTPTASGTSSVALKAINASGTGTATLTLTVNPAIPVITSAATASGTVSSAFSYQITATNSPTSYNATGLPSGLSVSTATGAITGTPTASGTSSVTLKAINASGTGTATLTLTINPAGGSAPVITSAATAAGTVNSAFSYQITAANSPTSYNATGLPSGLSVNTSTGAITGTPTASGTSSVTLKAINASGTGTATLTLTVNTAGGGRGSIGLQFVGGGTAMTSGQSAGAAGVAQTNWQPVTGSSFSSVTLKNNSGANTTAVLNGGADGDYWSGSSFPSGSGDSTLTSGELIDGSFATETNTITVSSVPYTTYDVYLYAECDAAGRATTCALTPSGGGAQYYSFQTEGSGSVWTITTNTWNGSGSLPSLPVANCVHYSGLTAASFTLKWGSNTSNVSLNGIQIVNMSSAPAITSALTASGTVSSAFSYQITASNSPTSYNATGLPSGLSVNTSTGAITGTPTASGTSSVTISAINASGTGTATLTLTINLAAPVITSATTAAGTVNSAFSYQITASNSPTSFNATGLPSGLSVNTSSGAITGTPTASGTSSVSLKAINTGGTGTATLTLTVNPVSSGTSSIAIQFVGLGSALTGTSSAGVVAQTHWNPLTGATFSTVVLNDRTGAATTATLTGSADGDYFCGSAFPAGSGDSSLCSGELYCGAFTTETNTTTVSGIPYAQYDVYVYAECDAAGRNATFAVTPSGGSTQYYSLQTTSSGSVWTQSTNTWNGSGTAPSLPVANYVKFTGLTATSFTLKFGGAGNVSVNGIQIVKNP